MPNFLLNPLLICRLRWNITIAILAFSFFKVSPGYARVEHTFWQYEVNIGGKQYWAFVILPNYFLTSEYGIHDTFGEIEAKKNQLIRGRLVTSNQSSIPETVTANNLLQIAEDWLVEFYEKKGLFKNDVDGSMRAEFKRTESLLEGNSAAAFICEVGNINAIKALTRVVTIETENHLLPMEKRIRNYPSIAHMVPRPPKEIAQSHLMLWNGVIKESGITSYDGFKLGDPLVLRFKPGKITWWKGDLAEVKNTANNSEGENLFALTGKLLAAHKAFDFGGQNAPAYPRADLNIIDPDGVVMWPGFQHNHKALISTIVVEVDGEVRLRFLQRNNRGQEDAIKIVYSFSNPMMPNSTTYWVAMPRDVFISRILQGYLGEASMEMEKTEFRLIRTSHGEVASAHLCAEAF